MTYSGMGRELGSSGWRDKEWGGIRGRKHERDEAVKVLAKRREKKE